MHRQARATQWPKPCCSHTALSMQKVEQYWLVQRCVTKCTAAMPRRHLSFGQAIKYLIKGPDIRCTNDIKVVKWFILINYLNELRTQVPRLWTIRIASLVATLAFSCSIAPIYGYDFRQE